MDKREPRVYYIPERDDRRAILVFDAGHAGGDVHVYEHKESRQANGIEAEVKVYLRVDELPREPETDAIRIWIEKEFGFPMSWKLVPE